MDEIAPGSLPDQSTTPALICSSTETKAVSDPLVETSMSVTLEQLRPYDFNPRVVLNPRYDELKASICQRGLDTPPAITRRPDDSHFVIRNGGNTRLAILRELWAETKDPRFYRIQCLFRPWTERGEIIALTGHLAENELHGGLSFIERALGIEKARELYEAETKTPLTQTDLALRLTADGYPVSQPYISRMQDAVEYLLPAIPTLLYGGLGRPKVERLTALRKAANRAWDIHHGAPTEFLTLFQSVLSSFDSSGDNFAIQRIQDELIGQMVESLAVDYEILALEMYHTDSQTHPMKRSPSVPLVHSISVLPIASTSTAPTHPVLEHPEPAQAGRSEMIDTAHSSDRLQDIQRLIAEQTGEVLEAIDSQPQHAFMDKPSAKPEATSIESSTALPGTLQQLRQQIAGLAIAIVDGEGLDHYIKPIDFGMGFVCDIQAVSTKTSILPLKQRTLLMLLHILSATGTPHTPEELDNLRLINNLSPLLQGKTSDTEGSHVRLSDQGLIELFQLLQLTRHLVALETSAATHFTAPADL